LLERSLLTSLLERSLLASLLEQSLLASVLQRSLCELLFAYGSSEEIEVACCCH